MNKAYTRIVWHNEPNITTPLNETNLNKMDSALDTIDDRVVSFDTTKADQSDLLQSLKTVAYNDTTGVFTFTFWNGNTVTVDLNIEKIPVSFSMSPQGVITMTTADGTQYTADVASLIKTYSFTDSSEIDFTVTTDASGNKTVTASLVAGSITGDKLQPNYLADCTSAKNDAETAAGNASSSAVASAGSSQDSEAWAVGTRNGTPVSSTDPTYENNAKYWAEHGSASFAGLTDTNFTNLQNGQIPKYNSTTHKWDNKEDAGGLLPHFKVHSEHGSVVTVTYPDGVTTVTATETSSGLYECDVTEFGTYTIDAVLSGDDAQVHQAVDAVKIYDIYDEHYSYAINVYAPSGSTILVTASGESYSGTGAGSTAVVFAVHQASTTYTVQVTIDGQSKTDTITSAASTGGSGSVTIDFGTINVTYDDEFRGETVTCTLSGTTITKTAPSSGNSMAFYPPTTGTWVIASGGHSVNAVVSSLSTAVSVSLQSTIQQTVTIYSAKEDTISYVDIDGDTQTITFDTDATSKQVTIEIEPEGSSITFTSGVAKDPSDLSNYYFKTVTITSNTTEVYLMSDNALYWWGYISDDAEFVTNTNGWTASTLNKSLSTPNVNTNNLTTTSSSNTVGGGIGTKETVSVTKFVTVVRKTGTSTSYICVTNNGKSMNDTSYMSITNTTDNVIEFTPSVVTNIRPYYSARNGDSFIISALWYE